jgi:hypothetical protein
MVILSSLTSYQWIELWFYAYKLEGNKSCSQYTLNKLMRGLLF